MKEWLEAPGDSGARGEGGSEKCSGALFNTWPTVGQGG
jgi:hypothetical protein